MPSDTSPEPDGRASESPEGAGGGMRRAPRRGRKAWAIVLTLLLVVGGAVAGYAWYLNRMVAGNISHEDFLPSPGEGDVAAQATKGETENILLVGSDSRPRPKAENRSDVIIIAHISADDDKVHLVHFPRDLWVDIPGHGRHKLNAAYEFGGVPLLVRTLQNILGGTKIDRAALVGLENFARMTDALGGVDVRVTRQFERRGMVFSPGIQHMDGATALTFVRERKSFWQGDVIRGRNQMLFLKALARKALSSEVVLNPVRLRNLLAAASQNLILDRDTGVDDLRDLAFRLRDMKGTDLIPHSAPFTETGRSPAGRYIVHWEPAEMEELGRALSEDTMDDLDLPERRLTPPKPLKR